MKTRRFCRAFAVLSAHWRCRSSLPRSSRRAQRLRLPRRAVGRGAARRGLGTRHGFARIGGREGRRHGPRRGDELDRSRARGGRNRIGVSPRFQGGGRRLRGRHRRRAAGHTHRRDVAQRHRRFVVRRTLMEVRSYRRVFELERRVYRVDRLRLESWRHPCQGNRLLRRRARIRARSRRGPGRADGRSQRAVVPGGPCISRRHRRRPGGGARGGSCVPPVRGRDRSGIGSRRAGLAACAAARRGLRSGAPRRSCSCRTAPSRRSVGCASPARPPCVFRPPPHQEDARTPLASGVGDAARSAADRSRGWSAPVAARGRIPRRGSTHAHAR